MEDKIKGVYVDKEVGYVEFWMKSEKSLISASYDGVEFQWEILDSDWHKIEFRILD